MGVDILRVDILGIDILGVDNKKVVSIHCMPLMPDDCILFANYSNHIQTVHSFSHSMHVDSLQ